MQGGSPRTSPLSPPIRIGQSLKNNQSITYSQHDSPLHQFPKPFPNPFGAQIYLQSPTPIPTIASTTSTAQSQLSHKYLLVCFQLQRLQKLSTKHQTMIFNLTQQIQIRITDTQSFRQREDILQRQLKRIQEEDKILLGKYHKLEQVLLEKNRLTGMLEEELVMIRNKMNGIQHRSAKDSQDKQRIRQLEQILSSQKTKNLQLDRQCKQSIINLERAQTRMSTKLGTDRTLLLNAENRIKELEQQLRVYVAQKRILEENELRFSQENRMVDQVRFMEVMREMEHMKMRNGELEKEKRNMGMTVQKEMEVLKYESRVNGQREGQLERQMQTLQSKISQMSDVISQKDQKLLLSLNQNSQLQYRLRSLQQQLKWIQYSSPKYPTTLPPCKLCSHLESENKNLLFKMERLEELIKVQQREYKITIEKSEKEMKNLRELVRSVNNLKGSNQRVERLIEVSASKLMRATSSKGFFSASTLM